MGWKPGKFLKKIGKGLKKAVKSIGKGIKKVVGKIGAAIGKLGVIGQIGMMFLMPYAMAGLSSFFGTVGTKIATWSTKLMGPGAGAVSKGFGKFLGAVHKAGSMAVNAYQTVSQAIGNGVDRVGNFFKGEGFTLSADRTSVFGATKPVDLTANVNADLTAKIDSDVTKNLNTTIGDGELISESTVAGIEAQADSLLAPGTTKTATSRFTTAAEAGAGITTPTIVGGETILAQADAAAASQTFIQSAKDYITELPAEIYQGAKDAISDPGQLAKDTIESGIKTGAGSGIANRIASKVAGDPPVQRVQQLTDGVALAGYLQNNPSGMYNTVNSQLTQQGSPWGAGNLAHFNYMQSGLSDGSDEYARLMQRIT